MSCGFRQRTYKAYWHFGSLPKCLTACMAVLLCFGIASFGAVPSEGLRLVQTITLPDVHGRIDHLSVDLRSKRLFVAALANNTLEIVDLAAGRKLHSVAGLEEPQGVRFVPEFNKIYVANGGNGFCSAIQGDTLKIAGGLKLSNDADNIRYDSQASLLFVGYGSGALAIIDPKTDRLISQVKLDGHPESFQLETQGHRAFVNVPSTKKIVVIDRTQGKVLATWPLTVARSNYPMALNEADHFLLVGFRQPPEVGVFNTTTGTLLQQISIVGDTDDLFYDAKLRRVYVIGGEGFVDVLQSNDSHHRYERINRISTRAGARTGLWVPEFNRLYVAVPRDTAGPAEIRVYEALP